MAKKNYTRELTPELLAEFAKLKEQTLKMFGGELPPLYRSPLYIQGLKDAEKRELAERRKAKRDAEKARQEELNALPKRFKSEWDW